MKQKKNHWVIYICVFMIAGALAVAVAMLLLNIQERKFESREDSRFIIPIDENELDPAAWGKNFPHQYDSFLQTENDTTATPYGGSVPYSKIERYPVMKKIWAGYSFSVDHDEERGHFYALHDQLTTKRTVDFDQPGACINCHSAEAPGLIEKMGWEKFNRTPYNDLREELHHGSSCADCHTPGTMELRVTRPAFKQAMERRGIDLSKASRQEMRTFACAQCHVEYYFKGKDKVLTFPWDKGLNIDDIAEYYEENSFADWTHQDTGAPMIKIQHPEFETWSSGVHAASGVSCADCHMPYVRKGAVKVSDHWLRSPLTNINNACQTCHKQSESDLIERVVVIQNRTAELLRRAETALEEAINAIKTVKDAGASPESLHKVQRLHRMASMYWDFVSSENSTGFHSSQEAARILAKSIDYARQAQLEAERINP